MLDVITMVCLALGIIILLPVVLRGLGAGFTSLLAIGTFALLTWGIYYLLGIALPGGLFSRQEVIATGCILAVGIVLNVFGSGNKKTKRAAIIYMAIALTGIVVYGLLKTNLLS